MLELSAVGFAYGEDPVVAAIDLVVSAGEIVCVVGANGAGKSTLLKLIAGLISPSSGRVACFGLDPARTARRELARRLCYLPQNYTLAFPFCVREVVLMGRYAHHPRGLLALESAADLAAAEQAMARCDVSELAGRRFDTISGGEQRRVLLAQAFCQNTELILLDEPTASLDPAHAIAVFTALRAETAERGASAVAVTHDLNLAARFADRVVVIAAGRKVKEGPPAAVLASAETTRAFGVAMHTGTLPDSDLPFVVPR